VERLFQALKPGGILAVLIGDKRKDGRYYPLFRSLLFTPSIGELKALVVRCSTIAGATQGIMEQEIRSSFP